MSWQPSPAWQPLTSGTGQATGGVWRTPAGEVVKRLVPGVSDPRHHAFWERQALVAESGVVAGTPGLRAPACLGVERDADGITLRTAYTSPVEWAPESLAAGLAVDVPLEDLLAAYVGDRSTGAARCGAVLVAAYTGVSRAAWALMQPDPGDHVSRLATLSAVVDEAVSHAS
ncbi:hypothetical protein ABZX12_05940 [Kribbella sp. NPDC003505]|uniref:hypothetical protein n=1 Tax=Kribbella sp. NPDC003505 TaxID=3154448 RepID=UPI0033A6CF9F